MPQKQIPAPKQRTEDTQRPEMDQLASRDAVRARLQKREATPEDIDELLDEIDSVLEENAEEFVATYLQKGGE